MHGVGPPSEVQVVREIEAILIQIIHSNLNATTVALTVNVGMLILLGRECYAQDSWKDSTYATPAIPRPALRTYNKSRATFIRG